MAGANSRPDAKGRDFRSVSHAPGPTHLLHHGLDEFVGFLQVIWVFAFQQLG